jgi:hypothetical protein
LYEPDFLTSFWGNRPSGRKKVVGEPKDPIDLDPLEHLE